MSSIHRVAPLVVSTETGGLGNRIKSWVSAMRLGEDVRVKWDITANMPASFEALFANPCAVDSVPAGALEHISWRLAILPEDEAHLSRGFAVVGAGANPLVRAAGKAIWQITGKPSDRYRYMVFPKSHSRRSTRADARHIDLEYGRIPEYFRRVYAPLFRDIRVQGDIARQAEEWVRDELGADIIGVQVRTWRDDPRRHRKYHLPAMRRLHALMHAVGDDVRFLVVSDSDTIAADLAARFGRSRILEFPRRTERDASWRTPLGIQEDLIDMLLLARTERLFVSYLSTFSEVAWWLGGATADVDVF